MKASTTPSQHEKSPSHEIDAIILEQSDWRGKKLAQLRALIQQADPAVVEEVKWKSLPDPKGSPFGPIAETSASPISSRTPCG